MKERILTSLITAFVLTGLQAQNSSQTPKLVVGLTIDQLRSDYIEAFSAMYGERGFKRLLKEGRVYYNAEYDFFNLDRSSAVASVYTGTTPYYNGIVATAGWTVIHCVSSKCRRSQLYGYLHFRKHFSATFARVHPFR